MTDTKVIAAIVAEDFALLRQFIRHEKNGCGDYWHSGMAMESLNRIEQAAAVEAVGGWRDIASAPRDGTRILVLHPGMTQPLISWVTELDVGYYNGSVWQPLPAPPAPGDGE